MINKALLVGAYLLVLVPGQTTTPARPEAIHATNQDSIVFIRVLATRPNGLLEQWTGSGFILNNRGFLLTNSHVVPRGDEYQKVEIFGAVRSRFLASYPLAVIKREPEIDLALLKLPEVGIPWKGVEIGDSSTVAPSAPFFVLGFPLDSDLSSATGLLSSKNAPNGRWQTTVPLNPGNSGGPVFDASGRVVGVVVGGNSQAQLINIVIPVNYSANLLAIGSSRSTGSMESSLSPQTQSSLSAVLKKFAAAAPTKFQAYWPPGGTTTAFVPGETLPNGDCEGYSLAITCTMFKTNNSMAADESFAAYVSAVRTAFADWSVDESGMDRSSSSILGREIHFVRQGIRIRVMEVLYATGYQVRIDVAHPDYFKVPR